MKILRSPAVSTLASAIVVTFIIAAVGFGIYLDLNSQSTSISATSRIRSTTHTTSCSITCETSSLNPSSKSTTQINYATFYSVSSVNSGEGCFISNVTAFSSLSLKVLSVGVNCSPNIHYGSSRDTNNQSVFNFNVTLKNTGNKTLYFVGLGSTPDLSVHYENSSLIGQEQNNAICAITSTPISLPPNSTAFFVYPTCETSYFYYPVKSGSDDVGLAIVMSYESYPSVLVNATLTFS